ncbi:MAG: HAD family hydrolase [Lachnospiraceae bacterium]|nr:HAD family hydrolase [Lachnospiraceae bacterium]
MKRYELLIFDMDGTILDTLTDMTDSVNYVMDKLKLPNHTYKQVRGYVGNGARTLFEKAIGNIVDKDTVDEAVSIFREYYKNHCQDKTAPYDGIMDLLRDLKSKGYKLAVVSNKPDEAVKKLVDIYFDNIFDFSLGEKEGTRKKPAPDMVSLCLDGLNESKEKTIYIGDSDVDYMTAKNSDLDVILVTWGFKDKDFLEKFDANYYVDKPSEIIDIIEN